MPGTYGSERANGRADVAHTRRLPRLLLITREWPVFRPREPQPSPVKQRAAALQATGLSVEVFAFPGRNLFNYAAAWTRLRPLLHRGRYDLVHAQEARVGLLALPKRVPLVMTLNQRAGAPWRVRAILERLLARRADAVILPSDDMRRSVGNTRAAVHVIPPDLDESQRAARLSAVYRSLVPERFSGG